MAGPDRTVPVLDGTTPVESFNIDLSADIILNAEPDIRQVPRGDTAVLPGYPAAIRVRLDPIENQIADKLAAMNSHYWPVPAFPETGSCRGGHRRPRR